ncbi:GMC oxidoreductase [Macrolepiota fuliginosa MF-IS2]|uniref:pyranose dehydrogenase (acceptor) n=1 Tax=Macrolepiota fuliginosa MF-IS2 TaxID=1400762 RepID=A0A9P5X8E4_9AGAR|nr:GMC oxidoreductase [Macrolepiota fuliginosa MF-IS2]
MLFNSLTLLAFPSLSLCANWKSIEDVPKISWDFIIVGGGTAGSVLANRLTENPKFNVLVIEAGPTNEGVIESMCPGLQPKLALTRYDWNFTTVPIPGYNNRSIGYQRGHLLGGSSSVNGLVFTRGAASDYDRWARVTGDAGWSWDNLQLYRERQEKFQLPADNHNITGQYNPTVHSPNGMVPTSISAPQHPTADQITLKVTQELSKEFKFNLDFNSGMPLGLGWLQSTVGHDGSRSSAATSYLTPQVQFRENLHILTDTLVTRVLQTSKDLSADSHNLTIRTIEITSRDNSSDKVLMTASKEVILSGGSIGSPHILLSSGIGDQNDLEKLGIPVVLHNPSVGRNLTDHPAVTSVTFGLKPGFLDMGPWANLPSDPNLQQQALALWKKNRTGPYTALVISDHISWTRIPDDSPIFKMFPDTSSGPTAAHIEMVIGASNSTTWEIRLRLVSPASRGSTSLNSSNPLDAPLINPNFLSHPFDALAMIEAFRTAQRFISSPVLKDSITGVLGPYTNATTDAEIENAIRAHAATVWHPIGTASMSPKGASWGVVDPDLRVKSVDGLRVVDASIMPYIPCAHPQAAVYFIAERAADLVKEAWR